MSKKKIFWAFDPYADNKENWTKTEALLNDYSSHIDCDVTPFYTVGSEMINWVGNMFPADTDRLLPAVEKDFTSRLEEISLGNKTNPEIVVSLGYSKRKDIHDTLSYLKEKNVDLIVLNSHARKGLDRFFMGSFAEEMLLKSEIPLLFVSNKTKNTNNLNKCFFATDLSKSSRQAFQTTLENGILPGKELHIYSKVIYPLNTMTQVSTSFLGGGWVSIKEFMTDVVKQKRERIQEWKELGEKYNFKVTTQIDESETYLSESILAEADNAKCDYFLVPSFTSGIDAALVGSTARELIRNSELPVLSAHFKL